MMDFIRRRPLVAALGAIALLLVLTIAVEAGFFSRLRAQAGVPGGKKIAAAEPKLLPPAASVAAEQAYPQTTARPLWTPTRRPAPPVEVAQAPVFQKGQFTLQGVIIAGGTRVAMLREKANGRVHRVEKGHDVNGIKVAEVERESVTLAMGGDSEVLALTVQKAIAGASAVQVGPFGGAPAGGFPIANPAAAPQNVAAMPPAAHAGAPGAPPAVAPPVNPASLFGPLPGSAGAPGPTPQTQPQPQPQSAAPMTPEELLARRRARRTPTQ